MEDINHHHLDQAHTEPVVVLDLMLPLLLSVVLILTRMEVSIVLNSAASINKVYKLTFPIISKLTTAIELKKNSYRI